MPLVKKIYDFTIYHSLFTEPQDKGHLNEIQQFAESIKNGSGYPIPLWQLIQATKISFEVEKQIRKRQSNNEFERNDFEGRI